jgi:hypothetical protein
MLKTIFSLIFTLFCQVMSLMIAPIWFDQPLLIPKKQAQINPRHIAQSPAHPKRQPREVRGPGLSLATIKQAQIDRLTAKRAQILQNYGVTEQQIDCQNSTNQQILNQAYSHNLKTDRFLASAERCLATCPTGCLQHCFDSKTEQLIHELIKNNGGDLNQIMIGNCKMLDFTEAVSDTKMFAYCSALTPGKHFLGIDTDSYLVKNLNPNNLKNNPNTVSHHGHEISCQLLFAQLIGHELCHIKYHDNLTVTLLSGLNAKSSTNSTNSRIDPTDYEAFCEERADILSVLNCPDPLATAEYLHDNCAEGLYAHRKSPVWQQLIKDLKKIFIKLSL